MASNDKGCGMEHEVAGSPGDEVDDGMDAAALPVVPLVALAGSGTFALWTSLTCFVC